MSFSACSCEPPWCPDTGAVVAGQGQRRRRAGLKKNPFFLNS